MFFTRTGREHTQSSLRSACHALLVVAAYASDGFPQVVITLPPSMILPSDTTVLIAPRVAGSAEGPTIGDNDTVYYTELGSGVVRWVAPDGARGDLGIAADQPNGLAFDALGRLLVCDRGRVWYARHPEQSVTLMLVPGKANDLTLLPDGSMYVTVPAWDGLGSVTYFSASGDTRTVLADIPFFPNGIEFVEEHNQVYIAFTQEGAIRRYARESDGGLNEIDVAVWAGSPDGMALDSAGNLWVANFSDGRIDVFTPQGDTLGFLDSPSFGRSVQNCCFGGPGRRTLYIAAETGIHRIATQVRGRDTRGGIAAAPRIKQRAGTAPAAPTTAPTHTPGAYFMNGRRTVPTAADSPSIQVTPAVPR